MVLYLVCDLHLILLSFSFNPAGLHASTKGSLSNSDAVSMLFNVCQLPLTWIELVISIVVILSSRYETHASYFVLFSCYLKSFLSTLASTGIPLRATIFRWINIFLVTWLPAPLLINNFSNGQSLIT